eukprot:GFYU01000010.1.p1 GENE.GFYU01000010.1~~GFYU01000010.1.p1  ORF type:complete len:824 (-),score=307.54 GFYU01000010.1:56-2527(-)
MIGEQENRYALLGESKGPRLSKKVVGTVAAVLGLGAAATVGTVMYIDANNATTSPTSIDSAVNAYTSCPPGFHAEDHLPTGDHCRMNIPIPDGVDETLINRKLDPCDDFEKYACGAILDFPDVAKEAFSQPWAFTVSDSINNGFMKDIATGEIMNSWRPGPVHEFVASCVRTGQQFIAAGHDISKVDSYMEPVNALMKDILAMKNPHDVAAMLGRLTNLGFGGILSASSIPNMVDGGQAFSVGLNVDFIQAVAPMLKRKEGAALYKLVLQMQNYAFDPSTLPSDINKYFEDGSFKRDTLSYGAATSQWTDFGAFASAVTLADEDAVSRVLFHDMGSTGVLQGLQKAIVDGLTLEEWKQVFQLTVLMNDFMIPQEWLSADASDIEALNFAARVNAIQGVRPEEDVKPKVGDIGITIEDRLPKHMRKTAAGESSTVEIVADLVAQAAAEMPAPDAAFDFDAFAREAVNTAHIDAITAKTNYDTRHKPSDLMMNDLTPGCAQAAMQIMNEHVGNYFYQAQMQEEERQMMKSMTEEVIESLKEVMQSSPVVSEELRAFTEEKLSNVIARIGVPNSNWPPAIPALDKHNYFANVLTLRSATVAESFEVALKPTRDQKPAMPLNTVNAYYDPLANSFLILPGISQAPFFDKRYDEISNLASLGTVTAHELSHSLDSSGINFDKDGRLGQNPSTPADLKALQTRYECMIDEFTAKTRNGVQTDGQKTLGENIADLVGMRTIMEIVKKKVAAGNQADERATMQKFFTKYAQMWCSFPSKEQTQGQVAQDVHSPSEFRVNKLLSNFPEFTEAFQCKSGDNMVAKKRCAIFSY